MLQKMNGSINSTLLSMYVYGTNVLSNLSFKLNSSLLNDDCIIWFSINSIFNNKIFGKFSGGWLPILSTYPNRLYCLYTSVSWIRFLESSQGVDCLYLAYAWRYELLLLLLVIWVFKIHLVCLLFSF